MSFLRKSFCLSFGLLFSKVFWKFLILKISLLFLNFTYKTLSFNLIYYSLGFCKEVFSRESLWSFDHPVLIVLLLRYLWIRGVRWGVVYSIVVIIFLVKSSSGLEILHGGEGGDVELWLEPRNKSLCLRLISCLSYLLYIHSFIIDLYLLQQDYIEHLKLLSREITRKKFKTLHGLYGF